jgi:hypothetical protein
MDPLGQSGKERIRINGLGDVIVHIGLEALVTVAALGVGGHGDNRQILEPLVSPEGHGGFEPVHDRHLNTHEHGIIVPDAQPFDGLTAVVRHGDDRAGALQELPGKLLVDVVVFDQEDARAAEADLES